MKNTTIFDKYSKVPIFGKRILHVASPVRWKGSKYEVERCSNWKVMVSKCIQGGFDSRRHPIYIEDAIKNSTNNFEGNENSPNKGSTEVFNLGKSIFHLVEAKIKQVKKDYGL